MSLCNRQQESAMASCILSQQNELPGLQRQGFGGVWSLTAQEVCLQALQEQKREMRKKSFLSLTNKLIFSHLKNN